MANRYDGIGSGGNNGPTVAMSLNTAFAAWSSILAGALCVPALGQIGTIADEWQSFVSRRFSEDAALLQRLSRSTGPDQVITAYAEFWRKAVEDYSDEAVKMTKLVTDTSSKMAVAAQSATEEASTRVFRREAA